MSRIPLMLTALAGLAVASIAGNNTLLIVQRSTVRHQRDSTGSPCWAGMLP